MDEWSDVDYWGRRGDVTQWPVIDFISTPNLRSHDRVDSFWVATMLVICSLFMVKLVQRMNITLMSFGFRIVLSWVVLPWKSRFSDSNVV